MKRILGLFWSFLILCSLSFPQTVKEMRFEEVKLDTVIKALAGVAKKNVIIDPDVKDILKKTASIYIQRPVSIRLQRRGSSSWI